MVYEFDNCVLDTERYQLTVADQPIAIEPLVFNLLVYLIEHHNRVVTRDELFANLWKGKVVTDAALGARLKDARRAVGDSGNRQEVIKTVHGRGYQFVAEIKSPAESPTQHSSNPVKIEYSLQDQGAVRYCQSADDVSIAHATVGKETRCSLSAAG